MVQCLITDIDGCADTVFITEVASEFYAQCSNCMLNAGTKSTQGAAIAAYLAINAVSRTVADYRAALADGTIVITDA